MENKGNEIDLRELGIQLYRRRSIVIKSVSVFFVLGILIAFLSKVEFQASCKLMSENEKNSANFGGLGGLAGLAGIDIGGISNTGSLSPVIYPEIVKSTPFQSDLINSRLKFSKLDTLISSYEYFNNVYKPSFFEIVTEYTIGLPGKIKVLFGSSDGAQINIGKDILIFDKETWRMIEDFRDRITIKVDDLSGIITISVEMPDPYAAAFLTDIIVKKLTKEVINYKIGKAKINLDFIQERYLDAELRYKDRQEQIAVFSDRNKNISSSLVQNEYQRLQNELNISLEVFKSLASQLEQAKIKVKEETPVFTVLEPVRIPEEKKSPKRGFIIISFLFIGFFGSVSTLILLIIFKLIS